MIWWQWIAVAWFGLGTITVLAIEFFSRQSGVDGPMSQDHPLASIALSVAVILSGPLFLLFNFWVCAQILWQGQIPLLMRPWWPDRAARFEPPPSRETTLCRMIDLRRKSDPRLRQRNRPSEWPMFELWQTSEAMILEIIENYFWLRDGDLMEEIALEKIEIFRTGSTNIELKQGITLSSYIAQRLETADPLYLELGPDVLDRAIDIAQRWAQEEIERQRSAPPYPSKELLKERVSLPMVESGRPLPYGGTEIEFETDDGETITLGAMDAGNRDWERIKLRMLPGDELWTYNGLDESWEYLAGEMGVALIRNGRPIAHAITAMN